MHQKEKPGKRADLLRWLQRERPARIGEREWSMLRVELDPISGSYLRRLLRDSGVPLSPLVEGVRQETFEALESSLLSMLHEYENGDAAMRASVRRLVIEAKDHARWAARKSEKRAEKEEMALWLLTWLENPPLFPQWVRLRQAKRTK
ncbi:MAG TPA: hypothetical protein VE958_03925 [Bryobacteraceae bacterium]|nr:hypothetical protein [Bryobacteraceae bacterium]